VPAQGRTGTWSYVTLYCFLHINKDEDLAAFSHSWTTASSSEPRLYHLTTPTTDHSLISRQAGGKVDVVALHSAQALQAEVRTGPVS